jgi:putative addiction module CopG family antidote
MHISLTPELTRLIKRKIASGQYLTAGEVVRDALLRLAASERPREERVADLRRKIAAGLTSSKAGRMIDGETAIKRLQARLRKSEKARRAR